MIQFVILGDEDYRVGKIFLNRPVLAVYFMCPTSSSRSPQDWLEVLVFLYSSYTEQLVLYMKAEECLSSALRTAKDSIKQGQLFPSDTVKRGENF